MIAKALLAFLFALMATTAHADKYTPIHIHLGFPDGSNMDNWTITWITKAHVGTAVAELTSSVMTAPLTIPAISRHFDGGTYSFWSHTAYLSQMAPSTKYQYIVGNGEKWSSKIKFTTPSDKGPFKFILYGDMGYLDSKCWFRIKHQMNTGEFHSIIHVGDLAYDLHSQHGKIGDSFMEMIEPVASKYAYQAVPGNHEADKDLLFGNWNHRFNFNLNTGNMYYSWQVGPVYFIGISSELYYTPSQYSNIKAQYKWLQAQLAYVNSNREKWPWVVVVAHRGFYCTNKPTLPTSTTCSDDYAAMRDGIDLGKGLQYGLEALFHKQGVDILVSGHRHSYERLFPVYKGKRIGSQSNPYTNPGATVQFISGTAGSQSGLAKFVRPKDGWPKWLAVHYREYGIGHLTFYNATTAKWVQEDLNGSLLDEIYIHSDNHGPFSS